MHGIDLTTRMDVFYHAMNYTSKGIIDATSCGDFKRKSVEEAKQLIEDLSKCNYKAPFETSGSSRRLKGSDMLKLNQMTAIGAKLDALMSKMGNLERRMHSTNEVGIINEIDKRNNVEEGLAHEGPYQVEEARYLNATSSYNFKPNLNLPTHYTLALRNHENFSYGRGAHQGQRPGKNFQQHYSSPGFQQQQQQQGSKSPKNQGQRRFSSFEEQMLTFMGENKRLLTIHEKKFARFLI